MRGQQSWARLHASGVRRRRSRNYALEATANATADGYTMGMGTFNAYLLAVISTNLRFNLEKDLQPLTQMTSQPYLLVVHPSVPGASLKDLIAYAKGRPGKLNYASSGTGGAGHLGMELFKSLTGMDIVHIPTAGSAPESSVCSEERCRCCSAARLRWRRMCIAASSRRSPAEFKDLIGREMAKWTQFVQTSGFKAEK